MTRQRMLNSLEQNMQFLEALDKTQSKLKSMGFAIVATKDFELQGRIEVSMNKIKLADIWWNTPRVLRMTADKDTLISLILEDNISNLAEWQDSLNFIVKELKQWKETSFSK
ncbi:MAG: hypothetical protein H7Z18_11320 [Methylophilaceae bacterium]|nr:hypothetical protein [Methylophilaceae bacterium]